MPTEFITQIELFLMYVAHDCNGHATYVNINANQFIFKLTGMTFPSYIIIHLHEQSAVISFAPIFFF